MRYLNRIIFINSARIRYAEINLDGNIHFIGTQGVGKSTLLRAILFFYNADTLGLGISRQKQSYVDYYFKDANAYIIYEVVRDGSTFCVVSYKSQHKVCFRFFDGAYSNDYFIKENGNVPDSWEGITERLDKNRIYYTKRKIDEYKEYRDILYGNNNGKKNELKRYSILESKEYQYLPKTIQNVFLNSKMEAEFIKQTIIMSLENDVRIDLNQYAHHLNGFETQLADIRKMKQPGTIAQSDNISKLYIAIRGLENEKQQIIKHLAWTIHNNEEREPELTEKLEREKDFENNLNEKLNKLSVSFRSKEDKIKGDIRIQEENLRKVKELTGEYQRISIDELINRIEKKNSIEKEQEDLLIEKEILSTQFSEINQKYQALLNNAENQLSDFLNSKGEEKNTINAEFLAFQAKTRKNYDRQISALREEYKNEVDSAREIWEQKKQVTSKLRIEKERIKHTRFYEEEIKNTGVDLQLLIAQNEKFKNENTNAEKQIETLQKHWELDEKELQRNFDREKEKTDELIKQSVQRIDEINSYIENSKNSLYGWLTEQYPDWENTIGKIVDEKNVLFNTGLSPKLTTKTNNFYGVEIDLCEIDKTVKTVDDYEQEKSELNDKREELRKNISILLQKLEKDNDNLKRKYQPKIREQKELLKKNEYTIEQNELKKSGIILKRQELTAQAEKEKQTALENQEQKIEQAVAEEFLAKDKVGIVEGEQSKLIKKKEAEWEKKIKIENERINLLLGKIETEIGAKQKTVDVRKNEIKQQKDNELADKGADTKRLSEIELRVELLKVELNFIETNRDIVADYRKDKREYLDRIDDFKQAKQKSEKQLETENSKYKQQQDTIEKELEIIINKIEIIKSELRLIAEDNEALNNFKELEFYQSIEYFVNNIDDEGKTNKRVKIVIDELKEIHYEKLHNRTDELRKSVTDFIAKFSDNNIFKFKKQLTDDKSFLDFALMLSDFVEENKIEQIEKEVNERFALIVSTIAKQATNLVEKSGEIQKVISKINSDFEKKIFVGVIKKIELKLDDSKNEIVQLLVLIKKYYDENPFDLGEANLFSGENQEKNNKKAVDLLKQFAKKIGELKSDSISLSDSFELKFRIVENDNDSGWVEKLSNVGSEGTDVLVKAMLNIMLLNVFKESASKKFKDFQLHCMMDEIGKLHPNNVRGILQFARDRDIRLISGSPIENDALAFDHIYKLSKDNKSITRVKRILTQYSNP
ncbi:ATP-binding protein [Dysgonomonas macrotermitis]|uniref:DNA repair exonuclease SbcCD ATPase subunit n=1 Tax=Dysgonomonas macrotermitis TaxID=1346286 RepID=A0A1M5IKA4_9BACT|nr:ATP-binding protein [Dysgonomonas macrotermitis]SHG28675.1 DNA repair exonuclease SbcCD ATPase subunit [Dysgonomonas macrotermitis]